MHGCKLPIPYPDELLYSVIARYHMRAGNNSPKWTLRELFGTENVILTLDLPSHISALTNLSSPDGLGEDYWIGQHTLLPIYAPFLPITRVEKVRSLLKGNDGSGIHVLIGITASTIERPGNLLYCPDCYDQDIRRFGEPYWHRVHQVPGVLVCPDHGEVLHRVVEPEVDRHGLFALPISKELFASVPDLKVNITDIEREELIEIARDMQALFSNSNGFKLFDIKMGLLGKLSELGLVSSGERVRQQYLLERFVGHYGKSMLRLLDSLPESPEHSWLTHATRRQRYAIHPLRMVLLIRFLYGSLREYMDQKDGPYLPFGRGPWPCLNKAAQHYRVEVIDNLQIKRCSSAGNPIGIFLCSCGFAYSRRGPDTSEKDRFVRGRIVSFGDTWLNKLDETMKNGLSYRAAAKMLGVDPVTVIKYSKNHEAILASKKEMQHRIRTQPKLPKRNKAATQAPRVNWELRDLELSWQVEQICLEMLKPLNQKPVRICVRTIGKRLKKLGLLEKSLHKLPITQRILHQYLENYTQFHMRKVRWAAEMMSGEWPLKKWKIEKRACLRPGYSSEVLEEIYRCIGQSNLGKTLPSVGVSDVWVH